MEVITAHLTKDHPLSLPDNPPEYDRVGEADDEQEGSADGGACTESFTRLPSERKHLTDYASDRTDTVQFIVDCGRYRNGDILPVVNEKPPKMCNFDLPQR